MESVQISIGDKVITDGKECEVIKMGEEVSQVAVDGVVKSVFTKSMLPVKDIIFVPEVMGATSWDRLTVQERVPLIKACSFPSSTMFQTWNELSEMHKAVIQNKYGDDEVKKAITEKYFGEEQQVLLSVPNPIMRGSDGVFETGIKEAYYTKQVSDEMICPNCSEHNLLNVEKCDRCNYPLSKGIKGEKVNSDKIAEEANEIYNVDKALLDKAISSVISR